LDLEAMNGVAMDSTIIFTILTFHVNLLSMINYMLSVYGHFCQGCISIGGLVVLLLSFHLFFLDAGLVTRVSRVVSSVVGAVNEITGAFNMSHLFSSGINFALYLT